MALRDIIESAFSGVPYPGDDNLLDSCVCEEAEAAAQFFRGRSWQGHSVHCIRMLRPLGWFSDAAFHYYLPAYLIAAAEEPTEADVLLDDLRSAFTPPRRHHGPFYDAFVRRVSRLSHAQREAVVKVFEHLASLGYFSGDDVTAVVRCFGSHPVAVSRAM
jgi:hypothetical protein